MGSRKHAHSRSKYRKTDTFVARAIRKYGWENCKFNYLAKNEMPEFCYLMEKLLIRIYRTQDPKFGYNMSSGGEKGFAGVKMSQDHKNKIANAHKGKKKSEESCLKRSIAQKGKKLSEVRKKSMSLALIGKPGRNTGKRHSQITKKRISNSLKGEKNPFFGKTHTPETIAKIIASNKRRAKK